MIVEYSSNNSGGDWWLKDQDWKNLELNGWIVQWRNKRWLDALATRASKEFEYPRDAMKEFEAITGQDVTDEGCNCCGAPHVFQWEGHYASGEDCLRWLFPDREVKSRRRMLEEDR